MEATFFPGASRRVTLGSPTLQVSNRRVCIPISMPLTGESFQGMPDWVGEAYQAVAKSFSELTPETQQITDITLHFSNDKPAGELFAAPSAKIPGAELRKFSVLRVGDSGDPEVELRKFSVLRVGDSGDPEVELQFKVYTPFTRDFWNWIGEMAGKEVYMAFPSSLGGKITVAPKQTVIPMDDAIEEGCSMNDDGHGDEEEDAEEVECYDCGKMMPPSDSLLACDLPVCEDCRKNSEPKEMSSGDSDMPDDPTMEEDLGPEFEDQVRKALGAPTPFPSTLKEQMAAAEKMDTSKPGRKKSSPRDLKAHHERVESKSKNGARNSLAVN